jgi:hypothetical protein
MIESCGVKMIKKCEENEVEQIENIFATIVPYRALILDNKLQYFDMLKQIVINFNIAVFELEEKYKISNSMIDFRLKTISGPEKIETNILEEFNIDISDTTAEIDTYRVLIKNWIKSDKISYDYLYEKYIQATIELYTIFTDLKISKKVFENYWNYLYSKKKIIIIRK